MNFIISNKQLVSQMPILLYLHINQNQTNMKKLYFLAVIFTTAVLHSQNPHWEWVTGIGASFDEPHKPIAMDAEGNIYTYAAFTEDIVTDDYQLNPVGRDSYFAKFDNDGTFTWIKHIQGNGGETIWGMDTDADGNVYITCSYNNGITIGSDSFNGIGSVFAKYDTDGNRVWIKSCTFTNINYLTVDTAGNIYAAGSFADSFVYDDVTLPGGYNNYFAIKLSNDGDYLWSDVFAEAEPSTNQSSYVNNIEIDDNGNLYLCGRFIHLDVSFGDIPLTPATNLNCFVVKYSPEGVAQWAKAAGNNSCANDAYDISVSSSGDVYLSGNYCNTINFDGNVLTSVTGSKYFLVKYDSEGNVIWTKTSASGLYNVMQSIDIDNDGNLIAAGSFLNSIDFGNDVSLSSTGSGQYVALYDAEGDAQWAVATGEIDINNKIMVIAREDNTIYTAGHMQIPSLQLGDITYERQGETLYNIWFGKFVYEDATAGADIFKKSAVTLYPNPAKDVINITAAETVLSVSVTDNNGRLVIQQKSGDSIDTSVLSPGIYFIKTATQQGSRVHKIIKE